MVAAAHLPKWSLKPLCPKRATTAFSVFGGRRFSISRQKDMLLIRQC